MTQDDIRRHYETNWQTTSAGAKSAGDLAYSSPIEDAVLYPIYLRLIRDLGIRVDGSVLDVGSGSGRWVRFFTEHAPKPPRELMGVDFAQSSIDLLNKWRTQAVGATTFRFERADITDPNLSVATAADVAGSRGFNLINIANVLFHIPEDDKFRAALVNLHRLIAPTGHIVTTEYMPRTGMRTEWMRVRSRYEFQAAVEAVGLRIVEVRATSFFSNDPAGIDGPDMLSAGTPGLRTRFARVRAMQQKVMTSPMDEKAREFFRDLFIAVDEAALGFCAERLAAVDGPSQKLVVLARAT